MVKTLCRSFNFVKNGLGGRQKINRGKPAYTLI